MKIKRQIELSNLLMVIVPVIATVLAGIVCAFVLWAVAQHGSGVGVDDASDFGWLARLTVSYVSDVINGKDDGGQPDPLSRLLDANTMYMMVTREGETVYEYGTKSMYDGNMLEAGSAVEGASVILSQGSRSLYLARMHMDGGDYEVALFAQLRDMETRAFRTAAIVSWLFLVLSVLLSVYLTNRFMSRALVRRISKPLDLLSQGAHARGGGDLDYRIDYTRDDEFTPLCQLFNEMAAKLKSLVERTQKDDESRKELIAGISHDLRSPLTSIQAYVEGLADGVASNEEMRRRYLDVIRKKVQDIDSLVSQLFLFSKLELYDYPVNLVRKDLWTVLEGFVADMGGDLASRGLELVMPADRIALTVLIDEGLLSRVLANVAENSLRYKVADRAHLWLEASEEDGNIVLILGDDGPGVGQEDYGRLFDVFYRSDKARRDPAKGSGLGLAISRKMVERMGGAMSARPSSHGGLAIVMTLKEGE